jgi:hypothetical protein
MCLRLAFLMLTHRVDRPGHGRKEAPVPTQSASARILAEAVSWDEVTMGPGRFGSTPFRVGRRELGHLHGESLLDLPLPPTRKRELLEQGLVEQHRYTPEKSGWVSLRIAGEADVETAIELLREQHARAMQRRSRAA